MLIGRPRHRGLVAALTAAAALALAPNASAATVAIVTGSTTDVVFTADAGVNNNVSASNNGTNSYLISDSAAGITAGTGCTQVTPSSVSCSSPAIDRIRLNLGDGDDQNTMTASRNLVALGGTGNDQLNGGNFNDSFDGGDGDDTLSGGSGGSDGADYFDGGTGNDSVSYASRFFGVRVDVDGYYDDGYSNEFDNVDTSVERVIGGNGGDTLIGNGGANTFLGGSGGDDISGMGGADDLQGQSGNDSLDGGYGADTVSGGDNDDTLMTRDSGTSDQVFCGNGADGVTGDREDTIESACETVDVPPAPQPVTITNTVTNTVTVPGSSNVSAVTIVQRQLKITASGVIAITLSCGQDQARGCKGTVEISGKAARRSSGARASRRSGPANKVIVAKRRFRLPRGARRALKVKASASKLRKIFPKGKRRAKATMTVTMKNSDGSKTQIIKPIVLAASTRR